MCLLVNQPLNTHFTDQFLEDVFFKNSDGLGVMFAQDNKVHVYKCLPSNADDFIDFYRKHAEGRHCVWHARMQTHGDIDMENCHPYRVTDEIWMAHNGILSSGNANDKTKSDTWHFIRNVLRPALTHNPDLMLDPGWQEFIGDLIGGSNKFGFVRNDGQIVVINRSAGVEFNGAWLSNTYAWPANKYGVGFNGSVNHWGSYKGNYKTASNGRSVQSLYSDYGLNDYSYDRLNTDYDGGFNAHQRSALLDKSLAVELAKDEAKKKAKELTQARLKKVATAAYNSWSRRGYHGLHQWVLDAPEKALSLLSYWYEDVDSLADMVYEEPATTSEWIEELFTTDSITPSLLS